MVKLRVSFDAPSSCEIQLQGEALDAYYAYQEDPSDENGQWLDDAIYDQCEGYIAMWSSLNEWDVVGD